MDLIKKNAINFLLNKVIASAYIKLKNIILDKYYKTKTYFSKPIK